MKHIYILLLAVMGLTACGGDSQEAMKQARREKFVADSLALKVAVTPTLDCLPFYVADEEGWFERAGVSVRLYPYQAQMDQDTALLRHHVEGMTTDRERLKWLERQGAKLREVGTTTLKWQLLTNRVARIRHLLQLDEEMIAMTRYSATDMLAQKAIDSVGLKPERVFRIQVNDVGVRLGMLETGIMDAVLLPEPQATQARLGGHPMLLDTDSMGLQLGVLVFTEEAMADTMRQRQVEQLLGVYQQALDSIAHNGLPHYRDIIVRYCKVKPEVVDSIK